MAMGTDFKTEEFPTRLFMKQNPIAKELRTPKYKMKVNKNKKKYSRKPKPFNDPFKELVMAISEKATLPDSAGRGIVKGNDVSRMKDFLEQESKDA